MNPHQQAQTARGAHHRDPGDRLGAMVSSANDADLVRAAQAGDRQAFSTLFERWFDRSYDVAWRIVRNRDTAAEVAQDTFLAAWTKLDTLRDADAFGGWVLRTSRNKALNRLEREGRSMAMDTEDTVGVIDRSQSAADVADDIVRNEQLDLVWAASAALGERDASILDLHLRHDLDPSEIAQALDITPNAAHQTLFRLRKRLEGAIRSYVLWHQGEPECDGLAWILATAEIDSFGPKAVKAISGHVAECDDCDERHAAILAPSSMFAAVPLVVVGSGVREAAAASLAGQGVPLDLDLIAGNSTSGGEPVPSGEDSTGLWQINLGSRRRLAIVGGLAAMLMLVAAVVGAGLLDDGGDTEQVASIAASDTTDTTAAATSLTTTTTAPTTTEPSEVATDTTAPDAPPSSTEPPLVTNPSTPSTTARPTTTASTTTSTTSTTVAPTPPPSITLFSITETGLGPCEAATGTLFDLRWSVAGADSVSIAGRNVAPGPRPPSGSVATCLPAGQEATWVLTATGPGGTAAQSVSSER
jgi:RNA polymerase sigma factor (sigma-70 family)